MNLLNSIEISGKPGTRIELLQGDLTSLRPHETVDLLVLSAFPDDYVPTSASLIGALHKKGLSVAALARSKENDMRRDFSCWLSQEFSPSDPGLRFKRILCFEPLVRGKPPALVGDIFRALTPILGEKTDISKVAMPLLAAGDQGYTVTEMLNPLLAAAIHWLERGLPLDCIKIVTYSDYQANEAIDVFARVKGEYGRSRPTAQAKIEFDVFISYAHENNGETEILERQLMEAAPDLRIFLDRKEIDIGSPWQPQIFESLDKCRKVVAMFSPCYLQSKVCKEEFNIAWVRSRETDEDIIFPIYLYSADLPTYMKYRNYFDCREGDQNKIQLATDRLITTLASSNGR